MIIITDQENKCIFCEEKKAIFYCNQCKLSFCNDCIEREDADFYCCANCNSTKIKTRIKENTGTGIIYICMDCKSTNIRKGRLSEKICPNCKSNEILTIMEKRNQLIQTFYKDIMNFKYGYYELNKFMDNCRVYKQELLTLRNLGYKHDAKIEQSLLWIFKTIQKLKSEIMDQFQRNFTFIRSRIYQFIDLDTWNPNNFYEIESIINQIEKNVNSFKKYVDTSLKPMIANLRVLKSKIGVIQYYKLIYDEYKSELHLMINELPVCAFKRMQFVKFGENDLPSKRGVLFITNKRIIFIHKKGFIRKTREELFNLNLSKIQNAKISGRIFKKLKLITNQGTIIFNGQNKVMNAIIHYLDISMHFQEYSTDDNFLVQRIGIMDIELSDLKNNMNNYISQILRKEISIRKETHLNNNDLSELYTSDNHRNERNRMNKGDLQQIKMNSPPLPKNYTNPTQLTQMPRPGSINITIPISQQSRDFQHPIAQVIPNSTPISHNIDIFKPEEQVPKPNHTSFIPEVTTIQTRPIIKLFQDKFSLEKTIENIEKLFNTGRISPEVYFKQFRPLQKELFTIIKMIQERKNSSNL